MSLWLSVTDSHTSSFCKIYTLGLPETEERWREVWLSERWETRDKSSSDNKVHKGNAGVINVMKDTRNSWLMNLSRETWRAPSPRTPAEARSSQVCVYYREDIKLLFLSLRWVLDEEENSILTGWLNTWTRCVAHHDLSCPKRCVFRNLFALISPFNIFLKTLIIYRESGDLAASEVNIALKLNLKSSASTEIETFSQHAPFASLSIKLNISVLSGLQEPVRTKIPFILTQPFHNFSALWSPLCWLLSKLNFSKTEREHRAASWGCSCVCEFESLLKSDNYSMEWRGPVGRVGEECIIASVHFQGSASILWSPWNFSHGGEISIDDQFIHLSFSS